MQSSEDDQKTSIEYFIAKPAIDNPFVLYALKKLENSPNPVIRERSLIARRVCGDESAGEEV